MAEVNLAAVDWMESAARCLVRGFLVIIDYGHDARGVVFGGARDRHAHHVSAARRRIAGRQPGVAGRTG